MYHRMCRCVVFPTGCFVCFLQRVVLFVSWSNPAYLQGIVKNSMLNNHTIIQIDVILNSNVLCNWSNKEN